MECTGPRRTSSRGATIGASRQLSPELQAEILSQALPYIQQFRGQTFVIKIGGSAMQDPAVAPWFVRNVLLLQIVGIRPVLVHGGGPEIDRWLGRLGMEKKTWEGLRVTDPDTMDVVEMALGRANKELVTAFQLAGGEAVGLSGRDGSVLIGEVVSEALGRVGRVVSVNSSLLSRTSELGLVPVLCSVAIDSEGEPLNINADEAAAAVAGAVGATKLILMTDTDGVLRDAKDPSSTISTLTAAEASSLIDRGEVGGGMIPKLRAAVQALEDGVPAVHLINGTRPHALLIEVFTDEGIGTMMTRQAAG